MPLILLFALFMFDGATVRADVSGMAVPRVRPTDRVGQIAMARGMAQSRTFRRLVERLQASDVIVHVTSRPLLVRARGFTQFLSATPHGRYLRITLAADDASDAVVALFGHELRHAVEAAEATDVRDQSSYYALYRRIGRSSCDPPQWCFDTAAAVDAGAQVYRELRAARRMPPAMATPAPREITLR